MVLAATVYTQHRDTDLVVRRGLAGAEIHRQRTTSAHHEAPSAAHLRGILPQVRYDRTMLGIDPRAARATWTGILILLLWLIVYAIRQTLFIFVVALLFAYLLLPLVDFIDRVLPMRGSRTPALAIVYVMLVGGLILSGIEIGSKVTQQSKNLAQKVTDLLKPEKTENLPLPEPFKSMGQRVVSVLRSEVQQNSQKILETAPQTFFKAVGAFANIIFVIVVPILSFFFLKDGRALQRYLASQFDDAIDRSVFRDI